MGYPWLFEQDVIGFAPIRWPHKTAVKTIALLKYTPSAGPSSAAPIFARLFHEVEAWPAFSSSPIEELI
jgi:hypothetical protein